MNRSMKKVMGAVLVGAAILPLAAQVWEYAADVPLMKSVDSGTETLSERLIVGNDQRVNKAGSGSWILPYGFLDVYWPFAVKVTDGGLSVGTGADAGTDPGAFSLPASITDKAILWVDAADPVASHLAGTGNEVSTWYDRREGTDVSSPRHFYAKADDLSTGGNPEKGTYDGCAGVFFGGVGSGKCMPWYKPNGSRAGLTGGIRHFFAVTGVSNSWGCIYGSINGDGSAWITDAQTCADLSTKTTKYFWNNNWQAAPNSRCFRNGERLDPLQDVQRGVQLVDMSMGEVMNSQSSAAAFFDERNISGKVGGDYLHEAICFTNALTEAELAQVRVYLMRKWRIAGQKDVRVKLAAKAELAVDTTNGVTTNGANVIGAGTIVKTGANDLVYRNFGGQTYEQRPNGAVNTLDGTRFDGEIDVRAGAVAMLSQAAVAVSAGKRLSNASAFGAERPKVTVATADADTLVKDGAGDVLVNGVPSGIKNIRVDAGRLEIRNVAAQPALDDGGAFEVPIPNASFEEETDDEFADGGINVMKAGTHGWFANKDKSARIVHMSKWTGNCVAMDNTTRVNWKFYSDPPHGDGAMYLSNDSYAETDVTIPSAGWYEVTFRLAGREGYVRNDEGHILLVGTETIDFGRYLYYFASGTWSMTNPAGYQKVALKAYVATPGAYKLRISRQPSVSNNVALIYDDFHLRRLADAVSETVPVPGGTFESVSLPTSDNIAVLMTFTQDMTVAGWTFAEPAGWTEAKPAAGISTPRIKGSWSQGEWYNDSRGPGHGFAEAFFRAPTTATTTFLATESGTFRVQADLGCFYSAGGSLQLTATVNGMAHDLGTLTPDHKIMRTVQWPKRLTLAKGDAVTLTFAFTRTGSNAGLWMDDVCFARQCIPVEGNLVKNGSFEKDHKTYTYSDWTIASGAVLRGDSETTEEAPIAAFGRERIDGRYFARFQGNKSGVGAETLFYQDVKFPREGVYRLSFYSHCRLNSTATSQTCPTKWWLAKDGVTNQLIRTANDTKGYAEHTADFYVAEAGTYRLGISPDQATPSWYDAMLDAVSIVHVGDLQPTDGFSEDMVVEVAAGAKLGVCFAGTNRIDRLRLGGRSVHGFVDAKSHPDYITGTGVFEVRPHGSVLIFR